MTGPSHDDRRTLAADLKGRLEHSAAGGSAGLRPIAFGVELVRSIVLGTKTQTRRPLRGRRATLYEAGECLWVREKWGRLDGRFVHAAQGERAGVRYFGGQSMPRAAARLTLLVLACRVEPLQSISDDDARAEGAPDALTSAQARTWFESVWRGIYPIGPMCWEANPLVVVIAFRLLNRT